MRAIDVAHPAGCQAAPRSRTDRCADLERVHGEGEVPLGDVAGDYQRGRAPGRIGILDVPCSVTPWSRTRRGSPRSRPSRKSTPPPPHFPGPASRCCHACVTATGTTCQMNSQIRDDAFENAGVGRHFRQSESRPARNGAKIEPGKLTAEERLKRGWKIGWVSGTISATS